MFFNSLSRSPRNSRGVTTICLRAILSEIWIRTALVRIRSQSSDDRYRRNFSPVHRLRVEFRSGPTMIWVPPVANAPRKGDTE